MTSYAQFSIQSVVPDVSKKQIVIQTNFKVDASSVNLKTVAYYNYDKKQLEVYKLRVEEKTIYINLDDYPANDSRYYLKISGIKDALGRTLMTNYDDYIKFLNDVKTKVEIISPVSRETIKQNDVKIALRVSEPEDSLTYRIEIGTDNMFFSKCSTLLYKVSNNSIINNLDDNESNIPITFNKSSYINNELELYTTINKEGQLYIRARAELEESVVGDWSEIISFNIYTISMDSIETTFLEDYLTTDDMFDDSFLSELEVTDRTENCNASQTFYIEFNKEIQIPDVYDEDSEGYIKLGNIIGKRKEINGSQKDRMKFVLLVDPDDLYTIVISPLDGEIQSNSVYSLNIKGINFKDGTMYSKNEKFITEPTDNYFVKVQDVKDLIKGLRLDDEDLINHIIDAGKTARYWMKHNADKSTLAQLPEFDINTIQEDYYPFYMFIKNHAIVESLKEFYIDMVTHPYKWRDMLSDLEREEEWDLAAIKALIDGFEADAEEWLELVVTITADPKWALRGKYCYSTYYGYITNPFHGTHWGRPPHDTSYNRGF